MNEQQRALKRLLKKCPPDCVLTNKTSNQNYFEGSCDGPPPEYDFGIPLGIIAPLHVDAEWHMLEIGVEFLTPYQGESGIKVYIHIYYHDYCCEPNWRHLELHADFDVDAKRLTNFRLAQSPRTWRLIVTGLKNKGHARRHADWAETVLPVEYLNALVLRTATEWAEKAGGV